LFALLKSNNYGGRAMKKFLFLYPIREYIDRALGPLPNTDRVIKRLNRIIDIRYRQQGFHIYWLMFKPWLVQI